MKYTYFLPCSLLILCTFPCMAQQTNKPLDQQVQTVIERQMAKADTCSCAMRQLTVRELIEAEEELQFIRDHRDSNATFEKYPYLLNPVYRRHSNGTCPEKKISTSPVSKDSPAPSTESPRLSVDEMIAAEEELSHIRNTQDANASFEKYPYLIDIKYRRATAQEKAKIRQQFAESLERASHFPKPTAKRSESWERKVGL